MPFRDACDLVPDDMPDGAYFAMAHEIAGLDYGDGFAELAEEATGRHAPRRDPPSPAKTEAQIARAKRKRKLRKARRRAAKARAAAAEAPRDSGA
jgi:hypothetical protein